MFILAGAILFIHFGWSYFIHSLLRQDFQTISLRSIDHGSRHSMKFGQSFSLG